MLRVREGFERGNVVMSCCFLSSSSSSSCHSFGTC